MAGNLTQAQYLMVSKLAYLNFTDTSYFAEHYQGRPLGDVATELLTTRDPATGQPRVFNPTGIGGMNDTEYRALLQSIKEDSALSSLTMTGFENKNTTTGFVAYAFADSSGDSYFAFRGSESAPATGSGLIDWLDNFLYGTANMSIQFADVKVHFPRFSGHTERLGYNITL